MKIACLIKQVPDTASKINIKADGSGIDEAGLKWVMNPYDEFAVEEAIKTKEKYQGETVVVSLGTAKAEETIRVALAMGIDKGILIDNGGQYFDPITTARILAQVLKDKGFDLILAGKQAIDADQSQVASMVGEFLDIPQVMIVEKIEINADQKGALVTRRVSGGAKETYDVTFPAILGCEKGLNTPRYATLPNIMKAKTKPVEKLKAADLLGGATSKIQITRYEYPAEKKSLKMISGEPAAQAAELVKLLREEAKVI